MSRKRWIKRVLAGLLATGLSGGCQQQVFMDPADYKDALANTLPRELETDPHATIAPGMVDQLGNVSTVLDPDAPARMMTLKECIAIALEQGNVGGQSPLNFGFKSGDNVNVFNGGVGGTDSVRAFAIDPAIAAVNLERSLSKFDARWVSSMSWQKVDQPVAAQFLSFQQSRDAASLSTTLAKPLPTGGVAGITFSTDYSNFNRIPASQAGAFVNPNYTPRVQFTFEQPLLRLFGVEANQLVPNHPGSQLLNILPSGGQGTEGILISRIRVDQQKAEFDRAINYLLVNIETAYWNLYAAYYNLYAQEEGLRQSYDGYNFIKIRVEAGNEPPQNLDQARAQFERFRRLVYQARGQVLESERQLRGLMGLRSDDGSRIVPVDEPNEAAYTPDFYESANTTLALRPELLQARQELKVQQLNLVLQKNLRRPDARFFTQYDVAGLGTKLDGREVLNNGVPGNALSSLVSNDFNSWTIGFRLDIPIGFRDANGLVREAQLRLARSYFQLRDSEMKALEYLVSQYRRVIQAHAEIGPAREERKSLQIFLGKTNELINIGRWDSNLYQQYLTVQRDLATAIAAEFRAIADYNSALAAFELAKGTIQQYNNVSVWEGALPPWVEKRAADHIRERTEAALKLRERDSHVMGAGVIGGTPVAPPTGSASLANITLPPFAEKREPVPDQLPAPNPVPPKNNDMPPPMPMGPDNGGGMPPGVGVVPQPFPVATPGAGMPGGQYFEQSGRVNLPRRRPTGPANNPTVSQPTESPRIPAAPPTPPVPLPSGTGTDTLPIPPADTSLPTPPPPPTRYPAGG